ncbi:MAG: hypothetical protein Q8Q31_00825 [Nanoarchaeota archaeon]|nr:hypothetical protein [Nanoarchaeota archaeon]
MSSEYIRLSRPENIYGERNLLKAQMEILKLIKAFEEYKRLRKEEFTLKILLKTKIEETKNNIKLLESLLPKADKKMFMPSEQPKANIRSIKKRLSLEQEIQAIKKKLEALH